MDSSSLGTGTAAFIDAVYAIAGDYLEPVYWVLPRLGEMTDQHIVFVCKPPMAHHASEAYRRIMAIDCSAFVHFHLYCHGREEGGHLIPAFRRYQHQALSDVCHQQQPLQTENERIISEWLNLAGEPEKLDVQQTDTKIIVRCGDTLQAGRLSNRLDWLVKTRLKFVEIYVGDAVLNSIALERLAKDDRHRFIYSLLESHQEILEKIGIAIDDDKVRLYCADKEDAIALHDGRWDLAERAQEQQLPQQFELYYSGDDQKPCLFKTFSIREGLLVKKIQRREIAKMFQKQDIADNS